ncbi:MAG TPA: DUF4831 family protein [Bacteroidaceae bacterium]|nr:DUF4831 family protein [Bacteroidaceae bacterium]
MKKNLTLSSLLLFSLAVSGQADISLYNPGFTPEGVSYFLPKTKLKVTVTIQKETYIPGELCGYAERYLKLTDISDKEYENWEIKDIAVTTFGVPDKSQIYIIKFSNKSTAHYVELTPDGVLSAINTQTSKKEEIVSIVEKESINIKTKSYLTEDIALAGSIAKMAELAAKEIYNIRESKNLITRGQADNMPKDGESLKIMLNNLNEQEQALLLLFVGNREITREQFTIEVEPNSNTKRQILFRFSKKLGVLGVDNLGGAPVYIDIENLNLLPLQVPRTENSLKNKSAGKKSNTSLFYIIPGRANVKIYNNLNNYFQEEFAISQFGNIETLSSSLFEKGAKTEVIFNTTTGNVINIK